MMTAASSDRYTAFRVWDAPTRWFHWINAIAVIGLIFLGLGLMYDDALGLSATGKILLKEIHVSLGYAFGLNLVWRFVWAFLGNRYARWSAILPGGLGFGGRLRGYAHAFLTGEPQQYLGHNPWARIGVSLLLLLLLVQLGTGLILAGTDLFWPPFGGRFAAWVAGTGIDASAVSPLASNTIDQAAYQSMRSFRRPVVMTHLYTFYALGVVIVLHLVAVIVTELHEGGSITSAMFTGNKLLSRTPEDSSDAPGA